MTKIINLGPKYGDVWSRLVKPCEPWCQIWSLRGHGHNSAPSPDLVHWILRQGTGSHLCDHACWLYILSGKRRALILSGSGISGIRQLVKARDISRLGQEKNKNGAGSFGWEDKTWEINLQSRPVGRNIHHHILHYFTLPVRLWFGVARISQTLAVKLDLKRNNAWVLFSKVLSRSVLSVWNSQLEQLPWQQSALIREELGRISVG